MTVCSSVDSKKEEFLAVVYEFMSNGSLDEWICGKRRNASGLRFGVVDRLRHAIGIASAIDYLHNEIQVPIVHCDLKPSNVLLDSDVTPKVADFGLAKLLMDANNQTNSLTSTHALRGSIGYIPPEYGYGVKPSTASWRCVQLWHSFAGTVHGEEPNGGDVRRRFKPTEQVVDIELVEQMNSMSEEHGKAQSVGDCMVTILGVGLSCADECVDARMSIRDALCKLNNVDQILHKLGYANVFDY